MSLIQGRPLRMNTRDIALSANPNGKIAGSMMG
jgi:hypothetical protein